LPPADDLTGAFKPAAAILKGALSAGQVFAGRYKLREKLGEGGMGEVWVADQSEPVQRRIALKVIKTGLDSARLLARFEQERQALALMDHPISANWVHFHTRRARSGRTSGLQRQQDR